MTRRPRSPIPGSFKSGHGADGTCQAEICGGSGTQRGGDVAGRRDDAVRRGVCLARPRRAAADELGAGIRSNVRQPAPLKKAWQRAAERQVVAARRPPVPAPPGSMEACVPRMRWVREDGRTPVRVLIDQPAARPQAPHGGHDVPSWAHLLCQPDSHGATASPDFQAPPARPHHVSALPGQRIEDLL